jgi:hypothetical protein
VAIQLPAPRHGWRVFIGEVGVIVIGVLVALGIGEAADALRWQVRVTDTTSAIGAELSRNAGAFEERTLIQPCISRRLREVEALVRMARRSGNLPQISGIGSPPSRPIEHAAWDVTLGSETLLHFHGERRKSLAGIYSQMAGYHTNVLGELEMWATLNSLENAPGRVSDSIIGEVTGTMARLKDKSDFNAGDAEQLFGYIRGQGIEPSYGVIFDREGRREELIDSVRNRPMCKPLLVNGEPFSVAH